MKGAYISVHQCRILCTAKHQKDEQGFLGGLVGDGQLFKLFAVEIILSRDAVCWNVTLGPNCRQKEELVCAFSKGLRVKQISVYLVSCV